MTAERLDRPELWAVDPQAEEAVRSYVAEQLQEPLALDSAVRIALVNNPELQGTFEELGIAQADLVQAGLLSTLHFGGGPRFPLGGGGLGWEFDSAVRLFEVFLIPLRRKIVKAELRAAKFRVASEILALVTAVRVAYFEYVSVERRTELQAKIVEADAISSELAGRQFAAGNLPDIDRSDFDARYTASSLELAQLQTERMEAREQLNRLMGLWGAQIDWTAEPALPELPSSEPALDEVEALAVAYQLELAAERARIEGVRRSVALARANRFTDVELGVLGEQDPDGASTLGPFVEAEIPIFDWGQAEIPRLEAILRQAQYRLRAQAIEARSEARLARNTMIVHRKMTQRVASTLVPQREQLVQQGLTRYNAMLMGIYDVLQLEREALEARMMYVEELRDYWVARAQLEQTVGGTLEAELPPTQDTRNDP